MKTLKIIILVILANAASVAIIWTVKLGIDSFKQEVVCGTVVWKSTGIGYKGGTNYDMVIDYGPKMGKQSRNVSASTFSSYDIGSKICFEMFVNRSLKYNLAATGTILIGLVILVVSIYYMVKFIQWLLDFNDSGSYL